MGANRGARKEGPTQRKTVAGKEKTKVGASDSFAVFYRCCIIYCNLLILKWLAERVGFESSLERTFRDLQSTDGAIRTWKYPVVHVIVIAN